MKLFYRIAFNLCYNRIYMQFMPYNIYFTSINDIKVRAFMETHISTEKYNKMF